MSDTSPILALPLIQPAQAQKHVTHNEALRLLDVLVQAAVTTRGANVPPPTPAEGERHITGAAPTGLWAGQPGRIAVWEGAGGWFFLQPQDGWAAHVTAEDAGVTFIDGQWVAMADRFLRLARLGVGTDADATNRLSVVSPATLLNHAGAGHQLKVNKATAADTASVLFQTGFSGRAEMGATQTDDFKVKVSADGLLFREGLGIAAATGIVTLPQGALVADGAASAPGVAFAADSDTGLFRLGADQIGFAAGGVQRLVLAASAATLAVAALLPAGSAAAPALAFSGDTDTGVLHPAADQIGLSTGGSQRLLLSTAAFSATVPVQGADGTAAAPALGFAADTDTGLFRPAADQIGLSTGGTQRLLLSATALTAAVPVLAAAGSAAAPSLAFAGDAATGLFSVGAGALGVAAGGAERAKWTATGLRLGAAGTDPDAALDLRGTDAITGGIHVHRSSDDTGGATLRLRKSRGTHASPTAPQTNDTLGTLFFGGLESGTTYANAATIVGIADGAFAAGSTPARLSLRTAPAGSNTVAERLKLDATANWITGRLHVNTAEANATKVTIADDAVFSFTPGRTGGFLLMTAGGHVGTTATFEPHSATIFYDVGSAAAFCAKSTGISGVGGQVDCVTGTTLTGTTGTDGNITVSAKTDGTLTIENRRGAATTFTLWAL